jgi:tripartite-type tricarboxylate transporter receptor subunit TctC
MHAIWKTGLAAMAGVALLTSVAEADWPERPITLIVPWAAGGGTDAIARQVASLLEEQLDTTINVVNRTGGAGIVGHTAMTSAEPDGYTLGLATAEIATYEGMRTAEISYRDLTPIALINLDAAAFHVAADSPWEDLQAALDDIRDQPGEFFLSGGPVGAGYHLALAGLLQSQDIDPKALPIVPSDGAAPGLAELAAGNVHVVYSSVPEARAMRDAGRVKTLAVLSEERLDAFPDVPTVGDALGEPFAGGSWRGIVAPAGLPDDIRDRLIEAMTEVYNSDEYQDFMNTAGFGLLWAAGDDFGAFMAEQHERNQGVIQALGLVD